MVCISPCMYISAVFDNLPFVNLGNKRKRKEEDCIFIHWRCFLSFFHTTVWRKLIFLPSGWVFPNELGDCGSISGRVIPKTQKMVLDTSLLNTQHYKVRFNGKYNIPVKGVALTPTTLYCSYWKESFRVAIDYGANVNFFKTALNLEFFFDIISSYTKFIFKHIEKELETRVHILYENIRFSLRIISLGGGMNPSLCPPSYG